MSRAALHGGPRGTWTNRSEVFQNLLLTTLVVVATPAFKPVDHGRPVPLRMSREDIQQQPFQLRAFQAAPMQLVANKFDGGQRPLRVNRDDNFPNLQFTLAQLSASFGGWDEGIPQSLWRRRDDNFPNLQFVLATTASNPVLGTTDSARPSASRAARNDPQPLNLALLNLPSYSPVGVLDSSRPLVLRALRDDPSPRNFVLVPAPAIAPTSNFELGRPVALRSPQVDPQPKNLQLFPPAGASLPNPVIGWDFGGRANALSSGLRAESLGLNLQFFAGVPPQPAVSRELGERPRALARAVQPESQGINLPLLQQPSTQPAVAMETGGTPIRYATRRIDGALGSSLASFVTAPSSPVYTTELSRPVSQVLMARDVVLGSPYGLIQSGAVVPVLVSNPCKMVVLKARAFTITWVC